jgi:nucleoside-diphosphate-sugar epimerase
LKILLTGSSGFLGKEILFRLKNSYEIYTIGRNNNVSQEIDLRFQFHLNQSFDCVIHVAGKAHIVPNSIEEIQDFWDVNVNGTRNLLKALENHLPTRFVFISSVAVYGKTAGVLLNEQTPLCADDPYGLSKIRCEIEIVNWCQRHKITCTVLRLPLVYGENPPGNLKGMTNAINRGYYFNINGGKARKSMVLASDVARFILPASEVGGIYHVTDGQHPSFHDLSYLIGKSLGRNWIPNMPFWLAKVLAFIGDLIGPSFPINSKKLLKIMSDLTFDDTLARNKFGWAPKSIV